MSGSPTAYTLLFWPDRETAPGPGDPLAVGEPFPLGRAHVGDCSSTHMDGSGVFMAACVLDEGHPGQHVASDGQTIVETWD